MANSLETLKLADQARENRKRALGPPEPYVHYESCMLKLIQDLAHKVYELEQKLDNVMGDK